MFLFFDTAQMRVVQLGQYKWCAYYREGTLDGGGGDERLQGSHVLRRCYDGRQIGSLEIYPAEIAQVMCYKK